MAMAPVRVTRSVARLRRTGSRGWRSAATSRRKPTARHKRHEPAASSVANDAPHGSVAAHPIQTPLFLSQGSRMSRVGPRQGEMQDHCAIRCRPAPDKQPTALTVKCMIASVSDAECHLRSSSRARVDPNVAVDADGDIPSGGVRGVPTGRLDPVTLARPDLAGWVDEENDALLPSGGPAVRPRG